MNVNNYDTEIIEVEHSAPQEAIDCFKKAEDFINLLVSSKNIEDPLNALPRWRGV